MLECRFTISLFMDYMKLNIQCHVVYTKNFTTEAIPTVCVGGTALKSVSTQKHLGIVFDKQLSWSSHVSAVCKKTSYYLCWINAHYKHMPSAVLKPLADSLDRCCLVSAMPYQCGLLLSPKHRLIVFNVSKTGLCVL